MTNTPPYPSTPSGRPYRYPGVQPFTTAQSEVFFGRDQDIADLYRLIRREASALNYDATLRNLELIGEAATHIPEAVRSAQINIPWRMIIATRNRLIHGYLGIDNDTVWSIIQDEVPVLLQQLAELKKVSA